MNPCINHRAGKVARLISAGCLALALSGVVPPQRAEAAPAAASAAGASFASVDIQKVMSEYSKKAEMEQTLTDMQSRLQAQLQQISNYVMLSKDQQQQLAGLLTKPTPTDSDRAQITEIEAASTKDQQELTQLQQSQNLTDPEKARLDVLTKEQQSGQAGLQAVADGFRGEMNAQQDKLQQQLVDNFRAAVASVAQQRGYAVVFDSTTAWYAANDITAEVVGKLNK